MSAALLIESWQAIRPSGGFQLIMADPPWSFRNYSPKGWRKGAQAQYECMTGDQIAALPVSSLADASGCLLWLWATNPMLPQALETLSAWGFTYKTAGHWAKWNAGTGKLGFGTGYVLRSAGEPFLIGTIGKPVTTRSVRSVVMGRARGHSRKPCEAYDAAEALMPGAKRIELFSRESRDGWVTWGDEAGKFDRKPADAEARNGQEQARNGGLRVGHQDVSGGHDAGRAVGGHSASDLLAEKGAE